MQNRSVTFLLTYAPKGRIPRLLELSQVQMTSHNKIPRQSHVDRQALQTTLRRGLSLTSCRSWNSDMSSLMKPCVETSRSPFAGRKVEGRVKEESISNIPMAFRSQQRKIFYPILFFGSLPPFLSTHLPHDSFIPYPNKPKSCPCPSKSGSECLFFQASTGLITTSATPYFLRASCVCCSYSSKQVSVSIFEENPSWGR